MRNIITQRKSLNLWAFRQMVTDNLLAIAQEISPFCSDANKGRIRFTYKAGPKANKIEYCATYAECQSKADVLDSILNSGKFATVIYHQIKGL